MAFTGGGTGGHILPNIAIIDELKKICGNICEFFYIGEKNSFEERIMTARGIPFYKIRAGKLRRYLSFKNVVDMFNVPFGLIEAVFALRKIKPDLVFAKGGYVSVPVVLAAHFLKIPVWLHESDVSAGLSNKICSRFAQKIWLSFGESKKFFAGKNVEVVGNPIRAEILKGNADRGYELTGFSKNKPVILIVGGSTGAQALNKIVFEALPELLKKTQVVHITGALAPHIESAKLAREFEIKKGYRRFDFLEEELAHIYAITDLIVSRAGSGSIFESLACAKPLVLVPLPKTVSRGDQIENAQVFEQKGFAVMLDQKGLSSSRFAESVLGLLNNESFRTSMVKNQKNAQYKNAAKKIAQAIVEFC